MRKLFLILFPLLSFGQDSSTYEVIQVIEKIEIRNSELEKTKVVETSHSKGCSTN